MAKDNKIIFLGTPNFAVPSLQALIDNNFKPFLVITQPDRPVGRKQELVAPPVKVLAQENGIPVIQPENKRELEKFFKDNNCEVAILVAYGMLITAETLELPKWGFLNIHPSLLPKYRGSSPLQTALLNGDTQSGVSIIKLTYGIDAGPIVGSKKFEISQNDNAETLHDKAAKLGAELLIELLPSYLAGQIEARVQDDSQATYTRIISREDGLINWQRSAEEIARQFKAFTPWPGVFSQLTNKRLKIVNLSVLEGDFRADIIPGTLFLGPNKQLCAKCGQGAIVLDTVQLEGKQQLSGTEFLRGQQELVGKVLD
ncbi:MAG: methionyl-tRNA formyltransferase [Patescibacteria group bacterium]|jgi:methionyl-tRNA formyltransferase|nr:methionyl-tRNA formyltransferase [Patescibacteria group bacterium]